MNGLKPEMREMVNMCKPFDLAEIVSIAYQMEDSVMYMVVCKERQQKLRNCSKPVSLKTYSTTKSSSGWSYKPQTMKKMKLGFKDLNYDY